MPFNLSQTAFEIAAQARQENQPHLVVASSMLQAYQLERYFSFFFNGNVVLMPDWETLPYDVFSPHQAIISDRLACLACLPNLHRSIVIVAAQTLLQRLAPKSFVAGSNLRLAQGQRLDIERFKNSLVENGYLSVSQVIAPGEFSIRGALIDLFPTGSNLPYRLDLFDDEIEHIRTFDIETQRSNDEVSEINLLAAKELPTTEGGINQFRRAFQQLFEASVNSALYTEVSKGHFPAGIEYYLPLFFNQTDTLFDYLPSNVVIHRLPDTNEQAIAFLSTTTHRYEQRKHDVERPVLPPELIYLTAGEFERHMQNAITHGENQVTASELGLHDNSLQNFLKNNPQRILFCAESAGRQEAFYQVLTEHHIHSHHVENLDAFFTDENPLCITIAPLDYGFQNENFALITEAQVLGERVLQSRRRKRRTLDGEGAAIANLTELAEGAPVVHEEHGIGRYHGLVTLSASGIKTEFLLLNYAGDEKLYVPVSSMHLIHRYTGGNEDTAPLHKLGSEKWDNAKRKAKQKAQDVAAELLDIHARRAAREGQAHDYDVLELNEFSKEFKFEETPDQQTAIEAVLTDIESDKPMDRVVCGDVGFGKTEVAMRAAFAAVSSGSQVAVLVPTTLLAQQHLRNFQDRFANTAFCIEGLSRFTTGKQTKAVLAGIAAGTVDIVIGTHKLVQGDVTFKDLGLVIIDEEQRFGVKHKEALKKLRAEVDILTLTATPIPRTLNMALAGIRDLSIIATPPANRHAVQTFISTWGDGMIREAILREISRGGQVYFVHNEVQTIEKIAHHLTQILPDITIGIAHGQMPERELESVMSNFYHQRFNVLLATTIIESGIDIPSANTIIIHRADKFGLSQLHQLRGRVGRSHHRAYAYLITPESTLMTEDAKRRLDAISKLEDIGVGFTLATHDLEIRGAGELLGDGQSGQIQEIGFTMYTELLDRAVKALKSGKEVNLDTPIHQGSEIDLSTPALLPDDYIADVHMRLVLYKRIANAVDKDALKALRIELIDRFGLLPEPTQTLFEITQLKLLATPMGVKKIHVHEHGGRLLFDDQPNIDATELIKLIQTQPGIYKFNGKDTLYFESDMPELDDKMRFISSLLNQLKETPDAD